MFLFQLSAQRERPSENEASSTTAANSTSPVTSNFNLAKSSNLPVDDGQLISRRHSSEILVNLGNENHNQSRSSEASNGYLFPFKMLYQLTLKIFVILNSINFGIFL